MGIINYVRANVFNSSAAALTLFEKKPEKYYHLATKILSVKADAVEREIMQAAMTPEQIAPLLAKQGKYIYLMEKIDVLVKEHHLTEHGKYWATPLLVHSALRINDISKNIMAKKVEALLKANGTEDAQRLPKSWFTYLTQDDRKKELAFFSPSARHEMPDIRQRAGVNHQGYETLSSSQGEDSDSFESQEGVIGTGRDRHISFHEDESSQPLYVNYRPTLLTKNAKNSAATYANEAYENIYDEIDSTPSFPPSSKC